MEIKYSDISCGIVQISGLRCEPKLAVEKVLEYWFANDPNNFSRHVEEYGDGDCTKAGIFSDHADTDWYGDRLAKFVKQNGLGDVQETGSWYNTTGNKIKLWLWIFDLPAMWRFVHGE